MLVEAWRKNVHEGEASAMPSAGRGARASQPIGDMSWLNCGQSEQALCNAGAGDRPIAMLSLRPSVPPECRLCRPAKFRYPLEPMRVVPPMLTCAQAAIITFLSASLAAPSGGRAAEVAVTCTNPFSGVSWRIAIDYDRGTVDSNPARISDTEISWRDAKDGWSYTLDRKSGKLTVVLASATGGNFLYDRCSGVN
jgi:hypothetical protein